jgi:phage gp36-like protein
MSYATVDDVKTKIDEATLLRLTDVTGAGVVDAATVERAVADAEALIDAYVSPVYAVPMNPVPRLVTDLSATLAVASLFAYRSLETPIWEGARDRALATLKEIGAGRATLEGIVPEPASSPSASATVGIASAGRVFSRDALKGM